MFILFYNFMASYIPYKHIKRLLPFFLYIFNKLLTFTVIPVLIVIYF